jgi:hypothetical protein
MGPPRPETRPLSVGLEEIQLQRADAGDSGARLQWGGGGARQRVQLMAVPSYENFSCLASPADLVAENW